MMQYYAYYSLMLANGGVAHGDSVPPAQAAAPAAAPPRAAGGLPALAPKSAPAHAPPWGGAGLGPSLGMLPGMGMLGMGMPGMGMPGMGPPGMGMLSPAQMHSMAQMAAAAAGMLPPPLVSVSAALGARVRGGLGKRTSARDGSRGDEDGTHAKRGAKRRGGRD